MIGPLHQDHAGAVSCRQDKHPERETAPSATALQLFSKTPPIHYKGVLLWGPPIQLPGRPNTARAPSPPSIHISQRNAPNGSFPRTASIDSSHMSTSSWHGKDPKASLFSWYSSVTRRSLSAKQMQALSFSSWLRSLINLTMRTQARYTAKKLIFATGRSPWNSVSMSCCTRCN